MSMDKRGDSWRFRVKYKRQTFTMSFSGTEKQAIKAHAIFKTDVTAGRLSLVNKMTMEKLAETVYNDYVLIRCKVNTQKIYDNAFNKYIIPALGFMEIADIKPLHIQKFANKLSEKLAPNTVQNILACLSKSLTLAEQWELVENTPYKHIQVARAHKNNQAELLSMDEITRLITHYENEEANLLHKSAFYLAIGCGLRNSEIRALTLDDIDFKNGTINIDKQMGEIRNKKGEIVDAITSTKTPGSVRKIYAPKFVLESILEYKNSLPYIPTTKQIYWSHITRKPISKHCLSKRFTALLKGIDITPIRFHDLRHLQATLLINGGANIQSVSKRLGHSKLETTLQAYTHSIDAVDKQVAQQLETTFDNIVHLKSV